MPIVSQTYIIHNFFVPACYGHATVHPSIIQVTEYKYCILVLQYDLLCE